jgi:hypothetical protein
LLDPARAPGLRRAEIVVELHEHLCSWRNGQAPYSLRR